MMWWVFSNLVNLEVEETLQYDPYEYKSQNAETFPMLDEEPEVTQIWVTNM